MIPKLELVTCPMPVNLLVKVKKALVGYPVDKFVGPIAAMLLVICAAVFVFLLARYSFLSS